MMITKLLTKIFGSRNDRILRRMYKIVETINVLEATISTLSDQQLRDKTSIFRQRLQQEETLDQILPEAFAVVREVSKRVFNMRHFDVQLIGGIVLHEGCIAEMRTGEGKTLTATLPAYLNALTERGVHIVTVNDYLAQRDAENNRPLFEFLGLSVGINLPDMSVEEKQNAYAADIIYGTNNEFGFDYLRDNMIFNPEQRVQRALCYALVDEVDSILIDEARTPLVISGSANDSSERYVKIDQLIPQLQRQPNEESEEDPGEGHFYVDEKAEQVYLTERGQVLIEELLVKHSLMQEHDSLYSSANINLLHHIQVALRAHNLFTRNVEYIVKDNKIIIVDEHTGRTMPGRRWADGVHQAIEAKEGVPIQNENQTLASITLQNYFRLYEKLSGMTGTADTEAFEFRYIYNLDTVVIPTNCPMIRVDLPDVVYLTEEEKFNAIIEDIKACVAVKRPVLVGTVSIERSEQVSQSLKEVAIAHQVLNAKFHVREAEIIAQAGRPGSVTIATNMAGRGTDIVLGGNWQVEIDTLTDPTPAQIDAIKSDWQLRRDAVVAAGGLHIVGTERHESRRIDNQLRGRAGRQGDPGSSRFYLSMDDTLMRIFASERVIKMMKRLGMEPGEVIEHPWVTKSIANAQRKVENYHFDIRKQLLEFDDVANAQRKVIYAQRNTLLDADEIGDNIITLRQVVFDQMMNRYIPPQALPEMWDLKGLEAQLKEDFLLEVPITQWVEQQTEPVDDTAIRAYVLQQALLIFEQHEQDIGSDLMRRFEKKLMLKILDSFWKEHLAAMDHLRHGIHLCGYAQKDPKQEYKRQSFEMFEEMLNAFKYAVISTLTRMQGYIPETVEEMKKEHLKRLAQQRTLHSSLAEQKSGHTRVSEVRPEKKNGRNAPCPCGSGKKYKQCHGALS